MSPKKFIEQSERAKFIYLSDWRSCVKKIPETTLCFPIKNNFVSEKLAEV